LLQDDRIITKGGIRYFPIPLAAEYGRVPRTTLLDWVKAKVKVNGRALRTYYSSTAHKMFLSEESVQQVAQRFVRVPSGEPAGLITFGESDDQSGYIRLPDAARKIGIDHHTLWCWVTEGNSPLPAPLDVVKCPITEHLSIREKDVFKLKAFIPRSGLHRGRRTVRPSATMTNRNPRISPNN
jgi:hypothetical protein